MDVPTVCLGFKNTWNFCVSRTNQANENVVLSKLNEKSEEDLLVRFHSFSKIDCLLEHMVEIQKILYPLIKQALSCISVVYILEYFSGFRMRFHVGLHIPEGAEMVLQPRWAVRQWVLAREVSVEYKIKPRKELTTEGHSCQCFHYSPERFKV